MDYENINGPMYCDFESLQNGIEEEGEGDEWFDRNLEELEDNDSLVQNQHSDTLLPLCNSEVPEITSEIVTNPPPPKQVLSATGKKKELKSHMMEKMSKAFSSNKGNIKGPVVFSSKQKQKVLPSRNAALKATVSIAAMYKPKPSSSSGTIGRGCTIPTTPKFVRKHQNRQTPKNMKSSQDLEMEKIEQLKWEAKHTAELSKQSFKRIKKKATPKAVRPVKPTTEAIGFDFKTDTRLRKSSRDGSSTTTISENVFPMNLRSSSHKNDYNPNDPGDRKPATPRDVTRVKPFHFKTDERLQQRKRHRSEDSQPYVSRAEYLEKFERTTPPRFRTKVPYDIASTSRTGSTKDKVELTMPKTPNLQSRYRSRPVKVKSRDQREEEELEELRKHQFKAKPINPDIFRLGGELGVRKPVTQPLTNPVSPCFATKERFPTKRDREEMEKDEEKKEFKAMPMPRQIFDKVVGVPSKRPQKTTAPVSPILSFKRRKLEETESKSTKEAPPTIKPLPMPDFSNVFKPAVDHAHTQPQPFSFENKYPSKDEMVTELVKKDEAEATKRRDFHAHPLPDMDTPAPLPSKIQIPKTQPKPFKLEIDERVQLHLRKFEQKVLREQEEELRKHEFHATENKALNSKPYEPVKSCKPLTESSNLVLHTALRSVDRNKFDEERKMREFEREMEEENRRILKEAEEEERIKDLRQTLVHKALPIPDYQPVSIKKSSKPLTQPQSPVLSSKMRVRTDN